MAGPIRQPINIANLSAYIDKHVPEIKTPLTVKQFGYGQSNPTYLLEASNGEQFVMRKQPPGKLLSKTAHQVDREYRIIHAMHDTDVPVPRAMCLCEDRSVIETPFYIMSYSQGRIFEDPSLPGVSPRERTEMWKSICTTLAKFHRVKPSSVGMEDFGRPWGFYNRQLKTFKRLSADQAIVKDKETGEEVGWIPHYDDMVDFFGDKVTQPEDRSTFVHGDYKVDNVVFHPTEPRVIAILDWEMVSLHAIHRRRHDTNPSQATIGHPLSDVTNLIMPFTVASHPKSQNSHRMNPAFIEGTTPGLPTKAQCVEWYASAAGYPVNPRELLWAEAFGIYRGAIIMQGIKARYAQRQASSEKAMEYGKLMGPQAEMAWLFVREVMRRNDEVAARGKGFMVGKATTVGERSKDEKAAEGKGYMVARPEKERSLDEKAAEGKGYMVGRPEKS